MGQPPSSLPGIQAEELPVRLYRTLPVSISNSMPERVYVISHRRLHRQSGQVLGAS